MATPGASTMPLNHMSPTLLTDATGSPIVPTVVPPAVDFDDYRRRHSDVSSTTSMAEEAAARGSSDETPSYFDHKNVPKRNIDPSVGKDREGRSFDLGTTAPKPKMKRVGTAPSGPARPSIDRTWQTERPKPAPRTSTLLGGMKRRVTGNAATRRAPYSYQFEEASSDSSSSSSSEEEGEAQRKRRFREKQKQEKAKAAEEKDRRRRKPAKRSETYNKFALGNEHYKTKGKVSKKDGRLNISINETANSGYIAKALGQSIKHHLDIPNRHTGSQQQQQHQADHPDLGEAEKSDVESIASSLHTTIQRPRLNIVIMVIGSRGDIQPFLKVGKILKNEYGHRVRIATHPAFREFVQKDTGLEFFSVGGDPSELMAFMVKNPGLIPSMETVKAGEIGRRRDAMREMFEGFWRACVNATDDEKDKDNMKMMGDKHPFVANAIIANPPSFAHVHIAERLGIPLHMMFTFPYSPTQQFPHPLANIKPQKSNVDPSYVNFMSYPLVEMMTWQGLGDIVNRFRQKTLGLEPVSSLWAPGALFRMKVPYTYMWSPTLVPKPKDWGPEIDLAGFVFLDLASNFKPPKALSNFLAEGGPPVYIGFGSIVVDDPEAFTEMIFKAIEMAGVRALVSKGWGGLGGDETPDHIFMLENTPHDWLFPQCAAVVHHGGAGTTAIGLKCGKPTMIVPFFGDQPFWGAMVADAKAGAHKSIPYKKLNAEKLAEGIKQCLTQEARDNVQKIADSIAAEGDGAENAVKSFHRSLPLAGQHSMRCSVLEDRVAVWRLKGSSLRLSALAADLLVEKRKIRWQDLRLLRHYEWNDFDGPGEPITGGGAALMNSGVGVAKGVGMVPVRMAKHIRKREEHEHKKQEARKRREERKRKRAAAANAKAEADEKNTKGSATTDNDAQPARSSGDLQQSDGQRPAYRHQDTTTTIGSVMSADPEDPLAQELAEDVGNGVKKSGTALITMPMDLHLAVAQGFHNAPRLWGDATVRKPVRITGIKSGFTAARKEFGYGIYDGWTGLVTQPVGGWKDGVSVGGKFAGMGKGVGKGIGGFVLKDLSAIIAPPAFLTMGVRKEITKKLGGPGTDTFIRKAYIIQGQRDITALESQRDSQGKTDQLERIQQRVNEAWRVYEEVWDAAYQHKEISGGRVIGSWRLKREKKRWENNGALENVGTADRALKASRNGEDLEALFRRRREEMKLAEEPRAGAMEQPAPYDANDDTLPNGKNVDTHKGQSSYADPEKEEQKLGSEPMSALRQERDDHDSDSTAVATPADGEKESAGPAEHIKFADDNIGTNKSIAGDAGLADKGMVSV